MAQRKRRPVRQPEQEPDDIFELDDEIEAEIDDLDSEPSLPSTRVLTDGTVVDADEDGADDDEEAEEFEEEPEDTDAAIPSIERDEDFEREVEAEIQRPVEEFIQEFSDPAITSDPVRMYLREIGRTALLTGDEEVYLSDQIHKGKAAEGRLAAEFGVGRRHAR